MKLLPISTPAFCFHRRGYSSDFCGFGGRCYQIKCVSYFEEFPKDCPLLDASPDMTAEQLITEVRKTAQHLSELLGMEFKPFQKGGD